MAIGVFLFSVSQAKAAGTIYYVDSIAGNDSGSGTSPSTAWKTLTQVSQATLVSGDSVLFNSGCIWREPSGQTFPFNAGVTYGAYGSGDHPQFEGATLITNWSLCNGNIYSAATTMADDSQFMVWEGTMKGTRKTTLAGVANPGDFYLNQPSNTLYYISAGGGSPNQYTIRADTAHYPFRISGQNGRLENLVFAHAG
ncbi:MAG: hypothetical protein ABSA45_12575, partial [Verrucomicrobiota bacterium]